jgi:hypothetical protein
MRRMPVVGQDRSCRLRNPIAAPPSKADSSETSREVCFVPEADRRTAAKSKSFNSPLMHAKTVSKFRATLLACSRRITSHVSNKCF